MVIGFAFNQGSFQAVSDGRAVLKDFTVPAAPPGSLDATLAAAGIPLFAIDLREAPSEGPVANWLRTRHKAREIGALYPEFLPFSQMYDLEVLRNFDVLVFVDKTTAAHRLAHQ
jgi:erythromycin esterase-like protein